VQSASKADKGEFGACQAEGHRHVGYLAALRSVMSALEKRPRGESTLGRHIQRLLTLDNNDIPEAMIRFTALL